jgi:monothiol glutaredoxin
MTRDVQKEIADLLRNHRIVLFMKGTRHLPQCGFSAAALEILRGYTEDFQTVNVLEDMEVRQGVKEFSNWPTIPQLYVDGKFIGGSDILRELHASGELEGILAPKT